MREKMNRIRNYRDYRLIGLYFEHEGTTYGLEVFYREGGYSYATYRDEPRGYYVSIQPKKIMKNKDSTLIVPSPYRGRTIFFEVANRFSKNRLETIAERVLGDPFLFPEVNKIMTEVCGAEWPK